jgi:hypothetical protein
MGEVAWNCGVGDTSWGCQGRRWWLQCLTFIVLLAIGWRHSRHCADRNSKRLSSAAALWRQLSCRVPRASIRDAAPRRRGR